MGLNDLLNLFSGGSFDTAPVKISGDCAFGDPGHIGNIGDCNFLCYPALFVFHIMQTPRFIGNGILSVNDTILQDIFLYGACTVSYSPKAEKSVEIFGG